MRAVLPAPVLIPCYPAQVCVVPDSAVGRGGGWVVEVGRGHFWWNPPFLGDIRMEVQAGLGGGIGLVVAAHTISYLLLLARQPYMVILDMYQLNN